MKLMKHLKKFEEVNVQDILSYDTKIMPIKTFTGEYESDYKKAKDNEDSEDVLSIDTDLRNNELYDKKIKKCESILLQYYNFIKTLRPSNISQISYERFDDYVGFSFTLMALEYHIYTNAKSNKLAILTPEREFIPIKNTNDLYNVLISFNN